MNISNLPTDVISHIMSQDPQLLLTGRQLSQEISRKLSPAYIREVCSKRITRTEIDNYLAKKPRTLVITYSWQLFRGTEFLFDFTTEIYTYNYNTYNNINLFTSYKYSSQGNSYYINDNHHYNYDVMPEFPGQNEMSQHKNYPQIIMPDGELDLLSIYKILRTRLGCLRINPKFAKEVILERFNAIVTSYLNHPSQTHILDLYLYLFAHTWVFNIEGDVDIERFRIDFQRDANYIDRPTSDPENLQRLSDIRKKINELIIIIRNELEKLN